MAKTAYDEVPLQLGDGTEVTLVPLNIVRLKRFMKAFEEAKTKEDDEFGMLEVYINCVGICLEPDFKDQFEVRGTGKKWLGKDYFDYLEEVLDMDTIFMVLDVCAGVKLNDPELLRAATEAVGTI